VYVDACQETANNRSYIGCEYYALDLKNTTQAIGLPNDGSCEGDILNPGAPGAVLRSDISFCYDPDAVGFPPFIPAAFTAGLCNPDGSCPDGYTCEQEPVCVLDAQNSPFAVVVSNPQEGPVDVTISDADAVSETFTLASGEVKSILPQTLGFADHSLDGSGVSASAYKIESSAPVVAYQFNPLDNVDVFSNDGSLLIARHAYDSKYYALTWPTLGRRPSAQSFNGYLAVVAWEDGTEITVKPASATHAGTSLEALTAGQSKTVTLNAGEVLNLESVDDGDLTGSLVEAVNGKTFGVFAGHEAIVIQNSEQSCCADHIEEMMFPASTWGKDFVVARSMDRGMSEPDLVRILAQKSGTTISFSPAPVEGSCGTLGEGDFCDVKIQADTQITATEPVLIGHYLLSVIESDGLFGFEGNGDPSLALAVPYEQYRQSYDFLVPAEYQEQYVSVVAQVGAQVLLDGVDVSAQLADVAGGTFSAARIEVDPGQHKLTCPNSTCGIEIYGYSDAVSYLFAGGLDLQQIVVE